MPRPATRVKALVYVAAYAPDEGDSVLTLSELGTDDMIGPTTLTLRPFPAPDGSEAQEGYINLDVFREIFAADLPRKQAQAMARSQRPAALTTLGEPSGPPAWKTIPSWYLVAGRDRVVGADVERAMAARIHPRKTVEVRGASHVVMISRPKKTTALILKAARAVK
jgi:pimeloyl-ACP methyl ester carboxylesterase